MKKSAFYITLVIIVVIGFLLLTPKVSTKIFPFISDRMIQEFISTSKLAQSVDGRKFWKLREFYSPGIYVFKEKGLTKQEFSLAAKRLAISFNKSQYVYPYLTFSSDRFYSLEALTTEYDLNKVLQNFSAYKGKNCIIDQKSMYMCYKNDTMIIVGFIKPMDEMQKTNGFFDYKRKELADLTKGKYWLAISEIKL